MLKLSIKKIGLYLIILCACLVCAWIAVKNYDWFLSPEPVYTIPRHIRYSFTLQNRTNRLLEKAEFWTYAPAKQTPTQKCLRVETSHPYKLISDDRGNQILHFAFHNLAPYNTRIITVKADLLLSGTPNLVSEKDLRDYLHAEKYCESDNPEITRLAKKLKGPETVKTAENIFRWIADNIQYTGYLRNARGALYALQNKKGDCTESMYLFTALCRANGIPARGVGGYVCSQNAILRPSEYHNWAVFYHDGIWSIADPQRKTFMQD
ncbi:transglutaminase domain-containing protein, partial [bacterium]|nr:transglutaminase domain-containing protein [bacterium]